MPKHLPSTDCRERGAEIARLRGALALHALHFLHATPDGDHDRRDRYWCLLIGFPGSTLPLTTEEAQTLIRTETLFRLEPGSLSREVAS